MKTANEYTAEIRKALKANPELKKISVKHGTGTAYCWVEISGSGEYGYFTEAEIEKLESLGIPCGMNGAVVAPENAENWCERLAS